MIIDHHCLCICHLPRSPSDHFDHLPHEARTISCTQHRTIIIHMVSEHMERYSQQFDKCRRKHLTSFGLVSLVYAAKLTFHIICWKYVGRRLCSKYFSTFHQCSRLVSGKSHHCPKYLLCSKTNDCCTWYIATKPMVT